MRPISRPAWPQLIARARVLTAKYGRLAAQLDQAGAARAALAASRSLAAIEDIVRRQHAADGADEAPPDADRTLTQVRPASAR